MTALTYKPALATQEALTEARESLRREMYRYVPADAPPEDELARRVHGAFDEAELLSVFADHYDLVTRFVSAELDPWSPSKRGIGRLADGDPPPRLGALHRKPLESQPAREELGALAERIVLAAFIAQAAFMDGRAVRPREEVRNHWLKGVIPYYHRIVTEMPGIESRARAGTASSDDIMVANIYFCSEAPSSAFIVRCEEFGLLKGGLRQMRKRRSVLVNFVFIAAGAGLFLATQDRLPLTAAESLTDPELLDHYEEPRNLRDLTAR